MSEGVLTFVVALIAGVFAAVLVAVEAAHLLHRVIAVLG